MDIKKIILPPLLFLFFHFSHGQLLMVDSETGEYKYENVIETQGATQQQLIERAKEWNNLYYEENSKITVDSTFVLKNLALHNFNWTFISKNIALQLIYDVEIRTKDNRYKYTFSNLRIGKIVMGDIDAVTLKSYIDRFPVKYQISIEEPIDAELTKAELSLENYMNTEKFEKIDDDW